MKPTLITNFRRASNKIFQNITAIRVHKHVITKFAKKIGLIYFGSVDQHRDEHRIIRGFTVSASHSDNHYCVGSFAGYDITVVDRSDAVLKDDGSIQTSSWLIMAFDLHTSQDIPHIFINANNHNTGLYSSIFTTFPILKEVPLGTFETYDREFTSRFMIYSSPSDFIETERLLPSRITRVLGAHFWPYSAEIHDGVLYVYSDDKQITLHTLDTMLENGLWLAHHLDSQIELV